MAKMKVRTLYHYVLSYKNRDGQHREVWQQAHDLAEAKQRAQDDRPVMRDVKLVKRFVLSQGERRR